MLDSALSQDNKIQDNINPDITNVIENNWN